MKMVFPFLNADDGEEYETMWIEPKGDHFVVMNSAFYAYGVSFLDEVRGIEREGRLFFDGVINASGGSTVRVYVSEGVTIDAVMAALDGTGCSFEGSDNPRLFALDVPAAAPWAVVRAALEQLTERGLSIWEEACISQHHLAQSD